jgi:hypothetical protein
LTQTSIIKKQILKNLIDTLELFNIYNKKNENKIKNNKILAGF